MQALKYENGEHRPILRGVLHALVIPIMMTMTLLNATSWNHFQFYIFNIVQMAVSAQVHLLDQSPALLRADHVLITIGETSYLALLVQFGMHPGYLVPSLIVDLLHVVHKFYYDTLYFSNQTAMFYALNTCFILLGIHNAYDLSDKQTRVIYTAMFNYTLGFLAYKLKFPFKDNIILSYHEYMHILVIINFFLISTFLVL
jgi:predicted membrane channel-forming protein YqfA (hemolysin III family)